MTKNQNSADWNLGSETKIFTFVKIDGHLVLSAEIVTIASLKILGLKHGFVAFLIALLFAISKNHGLSKINYMLLF